MGWGILSKESSSLKVLSEVGTKTPASFSDKPGGAGKGSLAKTETGGEITETAIPLSLILSSIKMISNLREGEADKTESQILLTLKREGNRLNRLISNLILMSEFESQENKYPWECFNIKDIITKVVFSLEHDANKKNIFIDNQVSDDPPELYGVSYYIKQVIANLLDNAIKFNHKDGRVTIKTINKGDYIRFEIKDTGIGIAENNHDKIFNPFQQVEDPMTRKVGGAGLGLAISKKIIDVHGGNIWAESLPNRGSKFIFVLPLSNKKLSNSSTVNKKNEYKLNP